MVRVLLVEGGLEDDLPADVLTFEEYCWALTVVTAHSLHFARDFPVLAPLRLRFHPAGSSVVVEWGSDTLTCFRHRPSSGYPKPRQPYHKLRQICSRHRHRHTR